MGNCTIVVCPARVVDPRAAIRVLVSRAGPVRNTSAAPDSRELPPTIADLCTVHRR